jgi:hypothetical protein
MLNTKCKIHVAARDEDWQNTFEQKLSAPL